MNDDGTMARLPDLVKFAQFHGLKVGTIADLISHRRRSGAVVERTLETELDSRYGGRFRMLVYVNKAAYAEHIALVKGDISGPEPVPVRMHALNVLDDVLHERRSGRGGELQAAMQSIGEEGRGIVVLLREPQPTSLSSRVKAMLTGPEISGSELRDYGVGAQILQDLGVRDMILLTNHRKTIVGLDGYGLHVVGERPIRVAAPEGDAADRDGTE
jgi:3,4-dihydroxy 2-butanone 4-phosphate synthase/GTP cyclohydrolase II